MEEKIDIVEYINKLLEEDETLSEKVRNGLVAAKAELEKPYIPTKDNFERRMAMVEVFFAALSLGIQIYRT
jgi:hypothetical protein